MADLPPADVVVTPASERDSSAPTGSVDIVISRKSSDGLSAKGRSYRAEGSNTSEVVGDAIRKVLNDPMTGEHIKR